MQSSPALRDGYQQPLGHHGRSRRQWWLWSPPAAEQYIQKLSGELVLQGGPRPRAGTSVQSRFLHRLAREPKAQQNCCGFNFRDVNNRFRHCDID